MALGLLREIASNIQSVKFYTIMADETADTSSEEQLVICFRWVDEALSIHENFIVCTQYLKTDADSIVKVIQVSTCNTYEMQTLNTTCILYKDIDFGFEAQLYLGYQTIQVRDLLRVWLFKGYMKEYILEKNRKLFFGT